MLSAVVFMPEDRFRKTASDPLVALSRSLGALVTVAVEGLIRDVIIAGPSGYELGTIADHAGCAFIEGALEADWLQRALSLAHGPACLVLHAGYIPGPGFAEEVRMILDWVKMQPGFWRAEPDHWIARLFPGLSPIAALAAPLDQLRASPRRDFGGLIHALRGKTLRTKMHRIG